jgi:hypothetical protein
MMKRIISVISIWLLACQPLYAATRYVCGNATNCNAGDGSGWSTGSNSGSGTSKGSPWKDIEYAATNASTGDTIIVGDGTYTNHDSDKYTAFMSVNGITVEAENPCTFTKGVPVCTAIIDGENNDDYAVFFGADRQNITVKGFKITRGDVNGVRFWNGSAGNTVEGCYIAYNGHVSATGGRDVSTGISSQCTAGPNNIIGNFLRLNGRRSCPNAPDGHCYRHDHHIYKRGRMNIKGNIFVEQQAGYHIKVDGYSRKGGAVGSGEYSDYIVNNTFAGPIRSRANAGEGAIRFYADHCDYDPNPFISNNVSYKNNGPEEDTFISITCGGAGDWPWSDGTEVTLIQFHRGTENNVVSSDASKCLKSYLITSNNQMDISTSAMALESPGSPNWNYRPTINSTFLDGGTSSEAPSTDILGVTRPKGSGYDPGAFEYDPESR